MENILNGVWKKRKDTRQANEMVNNTTVMQESNIVKCIGLHCQGKGK